MKIKGGKRKGGIFKKKNEPIFGLDFDSIPPSVENLSSKIVLHGTELYPTFRYNAKDASSNGWSPDGYGKFLSYVDPGSGLDIVFKNGSQLFGKRDSSIYFAGGGSTASKYFRNSNFILNPGTKDIFFEVLVDFYPTDGSGNCFVFSTIASTYPAIYLNARATNQFTFYVVINGGTFAFMNSPAVVPSATYLVHGFINRDENSTNGGYLFANAVPGTGVNFSGTSASASNNTGFTIGCHELVGTPGGYYGNAIRYLSYYQKDGLFPAGNNLSAWTSFCKQRIFELYGLESKQNSSKKNPTTYQFVSNNMVHSRCIEKRDYEHEGTKVYQIGSGLPRFQEIKKENSSNVFGGIMLSEGVSNTCPYSTNIDSWAKTLCSVTANYGYGPNLKKEADAFVEDGNSGTHFITVGVGASIGTSYTLCCYIKGISREWFRLQISTLTSYSAYFNIKTGVVGTKTNVADAQMIYLGDGWWKCWIDYLDAHSGTTANAYIVLADGDNDATVQGVNTQVSYLIWGVQHSFFQVYPASLVNTTTTLITTEDEWLEYEGDGSISEGEGAVYCKFIGRNVSNQFTDLPIFALNNSGSVDKQITTTLSGNKVDVLITNSGVQSHILNDTDLTDGNEHELVLKWRDNKVDLYIDNVLTSSDTSSILIPRNLDRICIGNNTARTRSSTLFLINKFFIYSKPEDI